MNKVQLAGVVRNDPFLHNRFGSFLVEIEYHSDGRDRKTSVAVSMFQPLLSEVKDLSAGEYVEVEAIVRRSKITKGETDHWENQVVANKISRQSIPKGPSEPRNQDVAEPPAPPEDDFPF